MANILENVMGTMGGDILEGMVKNMGTDKNQTQAALSSVLPILMNALSKNASTEKGQASLEKAIQKDHDGSILDNLSGFFEDPKQANGSSILKHILGDKKANVEKYISEDSGLSSGSVNQLLEMAAPLVMGMLGKQNQQQESNSGIVDILGSFTGDMNSKSPQSQNVITQLLDRDNDGSIVDDVAELGMSFLGKMFKK